MNIAPASSLRLRGICAASGYIFRGPAGVEIQMGASAETSDLRSKYWGSIETIVNAGYTGKRLFFRKGQHSSLHFHCAKMETYFVHSGCLLVRLRAGRGQDRWFPLRSRRHPQHPARIDAPERSHRGHGDHGGVDAR